MEELAPGDVVFRMLDDVGVAATVRSVDVSARTLCVTFNDGGGEESDVDFDEIELEDPAALALPLPHAASELQVEQKESEYSHEDHGNGAGDAPPLPRAFGEAPDIPDYPADSEDSPSLPAPAKAVSEADSQPPPSEQKEKPLTLTQMMAQLSARVESFAQQQEDLKHAFQKAHDERNVLTEEVRRSKEQVEIQEANRNRAAREYQLADMQLKRASADVEMALKKAVPFLTGAKPDFALLDYAGSGSSRFAGFPTIEEGGGTGAGGGGAKKYHGASPPGARAAIVTTVRYAAADVIAAFCRWHLFKGFVHIYLFFEDPQEAFRFKQYLRAKLTPVAQATEDGLSHAWMAILSGESVSIIVTDVVDVARADPVYLSEKRESSFMKTPEAGSLDTEIMARQCLNAEVAAARAATHPSHSGGRMDWLLHIDIDELFLVQAADPMEQQPTVSQHFSSVPAEVQFVAYVNHEAVPEHDGDIRNYFTEVCLFKQNPNVFKRRPQEEMLGDNSASGKARQFWTERAKGVLFKDEASVPVDLPSMYFLAYANGKSAVRLHRPSSSAGAATLLPRPYTVHRWRGQEVVGTYWQPQEACVLHYAQCGASAFQRKFQLLKVARTDWWKRLPLYRVAREACDDTERCREIYRGTVCLTDLSEVGKQEASGVCIRILEVQDVLTAIGF